MQTTAKPGDRCYFTFCLNAPDSAGELVSPAANTYNSVYRILTSSKDSWNILRNLGADRFALLFNCSIDRFEEVAACWGVRNMFGTVILGEGVGCTDTRPGDPEEDHLMIGGSPTFLSAPCCDSDAEIFIRGNSGRVYLLGTQDLYLTCDRLDKFSHHCKGCSLISEFKCFEYCLQQWAKKSNINYDEEFVNTRKDCFAHNTSTDEMLELIEQEQHLGNIPHKFCFVDPKKTRQDMSRVPREKVDRARRYYDCYLGRIDKNHEELSERAQKAITTKKRLKICDSECAYHANCTRRSMSNGWSISRCYGDNNYHDCVTGPFNAERTLYLYRAWIDGLSHKQPIERISFIAANAGVETRVTGRSLTLSGMDSDLQTVVFAQTSDPEKPPVFYHYEDAIELLNTQWVESGTQYEKPYLHLPRRMMTEEELFMYAELRQHRGLYAERTRGGRLPVIKYVKWNTDGYFTVQATRRYGDGGITVKTLFEMPDWFGISETIRSFREVGEAEHRRSTAGIRP